MKLLPKQLRGEHHSYSSDKSIDKISSDLHQIFKDNQLFRQELTGKFIGENEFLLSYKIPFNFGKGSLYNFTRLHGKISTQSDTTILNIVLKPSMAANPIFFGFGIIGILSILTNLSNIKTDAIVVGIVFTFIIPLAIVFYSQAAKNELKDKFVKTFQLKENKHL